MIVPLKPPQYLEFFYAADPHMAARHAWGRVMSIMGTADVLVGWVFSCDNVDAIGSRLGVEVMDFPSPGDFGNVRMVADSFCLGSLPIFAQHSLSREERLTRWSAIAKQAGHEKDAPSVSWVEISEDEDRLSDWLGDEQSPIDIRQAPGPRSLHAVGLQFGDHEIVLGAPSVQKAKV